MKGKNGTKLREWQDRNKHVDYSGVCEKCGKTKELTVDHIIPVYLLEQLGLDDEIVNDEENFEYVCITCNRFKSGRIDLANSKTLKLLKKYINKLSS